MVSTDALFAADVWPTLDFKKPTKSVFYAISHARTALNRCGLLLQMSHVALSFVSPTCWTRVSCAKTTEVIEMP